MIREFKIEDAKPMLEWMKDKDVIRGFNVDFSKFSIEDCKNFIFDNINNYNIEKPNNLSFAITDESNIYKGTVSLKHINYIKSCAEVAIVLVSSAHGSGLAKDSFDRIINYAFVDLGLNFIYFSCKNDNIIANKFYSKTTANLISLNDLIKILGNNIDGYTKNSLDNLFWYIVKSY